MYAGKDTNGSPLMAKLALRVLDHGAMPLGQFSSHSQCKFPIKPHFPESIRSSIVAISPKFQDLTNYIHVFTMVPLTFISYQPPLSRSKHFSTERF